MSPIARRNLLQFLAASATGLVAGRARAELAPNFTNVRQVPSYDHLPPFGIPNGDLQTWAPAGAPSYAPCKVLEIFLRGGASLWGSFWYNTGEGAQTGDTALSNTDWQDITGVAPPVLGVPNLGAFPATHLWQGDTIGQAAHPLFRSVGKIGAPGQPVTYRTLANYMRVVRVGHTLGAHELAIPFATTGSTIGRASQCGLGAAITRRVSEATGTTASPGVHSLIFQTGRKANDTLASSYLAATGNHGAKYRPPVIPVGDSAFLAALDRAVTTPPLGYGENVNDALKDFYRDRYSNRLVPAGGSSPVRSIAFSEYSAALDMMLVNAAWLRTLLLPYGSNGLFTPLSTAYNGDNVTRMAIRTGIDLLLGGNGIEHIAVVDGGVVDDYDTHDVANGDILNAARIHGGGIWNVCNALFSRTNQILDNNILVLIHSEFGREQNGGNDGTEHHTEGYTNVAIGPNLAPAFVGAVDAAVVPPLAPAAKWTWWGTCPATPTRDGFGATDVHAAVAAAAGIDPDQPDMYADHTDLACVDLASAPASILGI